MEEIILQTLIKMRTNYGNNEMIIFAQDSDLKVVADEIKTAINYTHCCKSDSELLSDVEKKQLIEDAYWLNLQNLSGREDFEEAFKLGIETGVDETLEKLSIHDVVVSETELCDNPHCEDGVVDRDMYGHPIYCQVCDKHN